MIGTVLGNRYEILSEIGSGGMARVYKARCRYLQRIVAIKVLRDEYKNDGEFLKRFETEAQAAASLTHPNIVQIYDVGSEGDRHYIVMEFVDGITLKEYINRKGVVEWHEAVRIAVQICAALSKAHSRHIIHRDIKPTNILVTTDGVPKVTDFGIARSVSAETATMRVDTVGSVHYSSPEQVRGGFTDEKSDIYSIGVTLYEMITGKLPFEGETSVAVALKHIQDKPALPSSLNDGIPKALDQIIITCLAKAKQERYGSVEDLIQDLESLQSRPDAAGQLLLASVKREPDRYATRKFEKLGDEELSKGKKPKKVAVEEDGEQTKAMKIFLPILYTVLIAAIIGGVYYFVSTVLGGVFPGSDKDREVTVGSYVGRDINEIIEELKAENITPYAISYDFNESIPVDTVIEQSLEEGAVIVSGGLTTLQLTVSQGPDLVVIPAVRNEDFNNIKYKLQDELGLIVVEKSEFNEEVASNMAIRTEPAEGTEVKRKSTVTLYRSQGPERKQVVVPDLSNLTYEKGLERLMALNLKVGQIFPEGQQGHTGLIIDQAPKAGDLVVEDTAINIYFEEENSGEPSGTATPTQTPSPTPTPSSGTDTFRVTLPEGQNYGETIHIKAVLEDKRSQTTQVLVDVDVPIAEFPYAIAIPVPAEGRISVKIYLDGTEQYYREY